MASTVHSASQSRVSKAVSRGALAQPAARTRQSCTCARCRGSVIAHAESARVQAAQVAVQTPVWATPVAAPEARDAEQSYFAQRLAAVREHFPTALSVDDFVARVEMALCSYGLNSDNTIAMTNMCRDEVTAVLKNKIDDVFGASFNTNGLGGLLSCGVTGMRAGFSHSPLCEENKERYVFFAFPHIGIDSEGAVGAISRPGRAGTSCACGALAASLAAFKKDGIGADCKMPGVHDPADPELSILKQRLARRIAFESLDAKEMDLVDITSVCERVITEDLQLLIDCAVVESKADYAVITGVQIHNWSTNYDDDVPNLEFVAPTTAYIVKDGIRVDIDLTTMQGPTLRQLRLVSHASDAPAAGHAGGVGGGYTTEATVLEVPKGLKPRGRSFSELLKSLPPTDPQGVVIQAVEPIFAGTNESEKQSVE